MFPNYQRLAGNSIMEINSFSAGITSTSFTPVRRRESTLNTRQFHGEQEKEWTAARCHRLLRALTSRVRILKKEISRYSVAPQISNGASTSNLERVKVGGGSQQSNKVNDPDWTRGKKRIRQTYSTRGGKGDNGASRGSRILPAAKGTKSLVPGEVLVPTPILARARGEHILAQNIPFAIEQTDTGESRKRKRQKIRFAADDGNAHFQLSETLRDIRKTTTASRYNIYEGIYNGLDALLRSTAKDEPQVERKGPRLLLSMALRTVPRYISQQEELLSAFNYETGCKSAISSRDISTEIYDELEAFGLSGRSWKHLRTIVRSHGVQVVSDAIGTGLLDVEFCGVLITLCVHLSAIDEAETLLSVLLSSTNIPAPRTVYQTAGRPLSMLWKFVDYTGRVSFQYRQLSTMLSRGSLPIDWLATKEFVPVWSRLMQSLSPESMPADALHFLDTSLPLLAGAPKAARGNTSAASYNVLSEPVKNTFSSLLTTLSSIVILSQEAASETKPLALECFEQDYEHVVELLRSILIQYNSRKVLSDAQGALLVVANLMVGSADSDMSESDGGLVDILLGLLRQRGDGLSDTATTYNDLVRFMCSVARCCGRGAASMGFEYLGHLHMQLETLGCDKDNDILKGVIVDSAYEFAQKVPDRKYVDYAAEINAKYCARVVETSRRPALEDVDDDTRGGFRWEEGIGEWVTATPAAKNVKRKSVGDHSPMEDTPFRPPPNIRQRNNGSLSPYSTNGRLLRSSTVGSANDQQLHRYSSDGEISSDHESSASGSDDELVLNSSHLDKSFESDVSTSQMEISFTALFERSNEVITNPAVSFSSSTSSALPETSDTKGLRRSIVRAPKLDRKLLRSSLDWRIFDESIASNASSTSVSSETSQSKGGRQYIDRAPRLGRRALRSSQAWGLFEESDDELSFLSVSSQTDRTLQDITNRTLSNKSRRLPQTKPRAKQHKLTAPPALSDSEDELCT